MHILFSVYFNSPRGGLHENVLSTVIYCLNQGFQTTVICKDGEFADRLRNKGSKVVTTNFESLEDTVEKVLNLEDNKFNIIHTHPGPSRQVALEISDILNIPIVATFHGMWYDSLGRHVDKLSAIFTVSEGVRDFLISKLNSNNEKFMIMRNGVNKRLFKPKKNLLNRKNKKLNISLVTRLDKDKDFILQIFYIALQYTYNKYFDEVKWTIVGDGTEIEIVKKKVTSITNNELEVNFVGWKQNKKLVKCYQESDIVIAPGRCALEAMACGKPVISIGSKKYNGLITNENWTKGVYTNFGGFGSKMDDYQNGAIENDLDKLLSDAEYRKKLGYLGIVITDEFFNERAINSNIVSVYRIILSGG